MIKREHILDNTCTELQQWFDDLWADKTLTKDVKKDVLAALARIGREYAAELNPPSDSSMINGIMNYEM